jgi:integrase
MADNFAVTKHSKKYWLDKIYKPVRRGVESANYAVRFWHAGLEARMSLNTPNQAAAADLAREMFVYLSANGWEAFQAKYRNPAQSARTETVQKKSNVTVGEFLSAVRVESDLSRKTFDSYARQLRYIVGEICAIQKNRARFDYRKGGTKKWAERIDAIPLAEVTPDKIRAWKKRYVERADRDELARRRYTVTCNSYLRQARALFSKRNVLDKLRSIELPAVLPFTGINLEPRTDTKFYGCGIDAPTLLSMAINELSETRTEELKAFLLAITLGLRRREADLLEWASFDFIAGTLRIRATQWYALKTNESAGELPVEPEVLELFRGWRARATGLFVIESDRPPKAVTYQYYRCQETFKCLLDWLRTKGVQGNKPLHAMRKLYGSALADQHGLHAASSGLRHSDIRTTAEFYLNRSVKVTPGFGSAISGAKILNFTPELQTPKHA